MGHAMRAFLIVSAAFLAALSVSARPAAEPILEAGGLDSAASSPSVTSPSANADRVSDCVTFELRPGKVIDGRLAMVQRITNNCSTDVNYETCMTAVPWQSRLTDYYVAFNVTALPPGQTDQGSVWWLPMSKQVGDHQISSCWGRSCVVTSPACRSLDSALNFASLEEEHVRSLSVGQTALASFGGSDDD
jgi:hypothetical protein